MSYSREVATALVNIGAVGFSLKEPVTFKSGIISPVYVDNRMLPFYPDKWDLVLKGFAALLAEHHVEYDFIAGVETAGIPHSAALGRDLSKPSVFVRKETKDHGKKNKVEGGNVSGLTGILIEDHVTTSGSALNGVENLRDAGATIETCLAITTYGFIESVQAFRERGVNLLTITSFHTILEVGLERELLDQLDKKMIEDWLYDPSGWGKRHGFTNT